MPTSPHDENDPSVDLQPYRGRFSPYVVALMLFVLAITISIIGAQIHIARKYSKQQALLQQTPSASSIPWIIDDTQESEDAGATPSPTPRLVPNLVPTPPPSSSATPGAPLP